MNQENNRPFRVVWPLMISQTIGAFNDNAMKAMLPVMAAVQFGKATMDSVNQQVSILLILPFVIFAPLAGWICDRFSKRLVVRYTLFAQLLGLGVLALAFRQKSLEYALAGFFILSVQSAFFSPAKKGILKELIGSNRLAKAVGFMEMLAMVGILGGAFLGAYAFDQLVEERGGWEAGLLVCAFISVLALFSWIISGPIPETQVTGNKPFRLSLMVSHFSDLFYLLKHKELRYAALGDAWFWAVGGFFYLVLVKLSGEVVSGKVGMGTLYGYWFLLLGVGTMLGSLFSAYLNRGRIELGLSAIGALGMAIVFISLVITKPLNLIFDGLCLTLGFLGALFFVPLNGYLQDKAAENERGRVLAASNLLTQLSGILLVLVHAFLSNVLGFSAKEELLVIFFPALLIGVITLKFLLEDFFRALFHVLLKIFYRIKIEGMENFPATGGCVIVSNHLSYADPVLLGAAFPRKIRYLAYSGLADSRIMNFVFRLTKTLTVSSEKSLESIRISVKSLRKGTPLCVFAEGGISRVGNLLPFMRGPVLLAKKANVSLIPVHLDGVWGSIFSMDRGKFFRKRPHKIPYPVTVRVGSPMDHRQIEQESCLYEVMKLGRHSFNERLSKKLRNKNFLRNQILSTGNDLLFEDEKGSRLTRSEFVDIIKGNKNASAEFPEIWIDQVQEVLKGDSKKIEMQISNWMRIRETHIWDHEKLILNDYGEEWMNQFLPWASVFWGRTIYREGNSYILISKAAPLKKPVLTLSGLASGDNGLISINASSDKVEIEQDGQNSTVKFFKKSTFGRLLIGFGCRHEKDSFYIHGLKQEERVNSSGLDEEGFLIAD